MMLHFFGQNDWSFGEIRYLSDLILLELICIFKSSIMCFREIDAKYFHACTFKSMVSSWLTVILIITKCP